MEQKHRKRDWDKKQLEKDMKELAKELGLAPHCSITYNFINIVRCPYLNSAQQALAESLYESYFIIMGKEEALKDFYIESDNFNL